MSIIIFYEKGSRIPHLTNIENKKTKFVYTDLKPTFSSARNRIIKDNKLRNLIQHCNNTLQAASACFDLI